MSFFMILCCIKDHLTQYRGKICPSTRHMPGVQPSKHSAEAQIQSISFCICFILNLSRGWFKNIFRTAALNTYNMLLTCYPTKKHRFSEEAIYCEINIFTGTVFIFHLEKYIWKKKIAFASGLVLC